MLFKALISMNFMLFGKMKKWNAVVPNIPLFQYSKITMYYPEELKL